MLEFWNGKIPWVSPKDMKSDRIWDTEDHVTRTAASKSRLNLVPAGSVLCVVRSGILSRSFPVALAMGELTFNQDINAIVAEAGKVVPEYLLYVLSNMESEVLESGVKRGGTVHSLRSRFLHELQIPLPSLKTQGRIVKEIEAERALVEANRELVDVFEQKIQARLAEIWGETSE